MFIITWVVLIKVQYYQFRSNDPAFWWLIRNVFAATFSNKIMSEGITVRLMWRSQINASAYIFDSGKAVLETVLYTSTPNLQQKK